MGCTVCETKKPLRWQFSFGSLGASSLLHLIGVGGQHLGRRRKRSCMLIRRHGEIEAVIVPPVRDLGDGFKVRRALPSVHRRMVGPFIFFDQMGPAQFSAGEGLDVRPHPHIGLSTMTYVLKGEMVHRDSLGSVQTIGPGAVNWMTAGSGIVHSERTGAQVRAVGGDLFGVQAWLALPTRYEETAPAFVHHHATAIPNAGADGVSLRLLVGAIEGLVSPVETFSEALYADLVLSPRARYQMQAQHSERAIYVLSGDVSFDGQTGSHGASSLIVLRPRSPVVISAPAGARCILIGGEPLPEKRHIFWNFVSSRPERIEQAKEDWRQQRFTAVPGEADPVALPAAPAPVHYP
jgi:redox-sensitive bicupin YhaK (pirin superfamily)